MPIVPIDVVQNTCLHGQGQKQCRYLGADLSKSHIFYCLKTMQEKRLIDEEVSAWLNIRLAEKRDNEHITPLGDNCAGYNLVSIKAQFLKEVQALEAAQTGEG